MKMLLLLLLLLLLLFEEARGERAKFVLLRYSLLIFCIFLLFLFKQLLVASLLQFASSLLFNYSHSPAGGRRRVGKRGISGSQPSAGEARSPSFPQIRGTSGF